MKRKINNEALALLLTITIALASGCGDESSDVAAPQRPGAAPTLPSAPGATPAPSPDPSATPSPSVSPGAVAVSIPPGSTGRGAQAYGTNPLVVTPGTTVTWTNNDTMPHSVTADDNSFDSGTLLAGQTFSHTFDAVGTFSYYCTIHGRPSMSGAVQVTP